MARETRLHTRAIREHGQEITGSLHDYDSLVELAGNSRFALLGEASHGTHDFYHTRAEITKRLIEEKGFCGVAVEAQQFDAVIHLDHTRAVEPLERTSHWESG